MMKMKLIAIALGGQDGAIWNKTLFRFNEKGLCRVYDLHSLAYESENTVELPVSAEFYLDRAPDFVPHCNAVMFGKEYYADGDEFPLLYANIYNNYAKNENPYCGVCCVSRLQRKGNSFVTTLIQLIEIGFTADAHYWASSETEKDRRPYGNFTIDTETGIYYAFTMRDHCNRSRYFAFTLPRKDDGIYDEAFGVNRVVLQTSDIRWMFDCDYHHFVQGACCHNGKIYSVEGFTDSAENQPALRVIDPKLQQQECYVRFADHGATIEPEFIDFDGEVCLYGDGYGNLYKLDF